MNADLFWRIIESSRSGFDPNRADGNMEQQLEELRSLLRELSPEEIVGFRNQLLDYVDAAFTWDLWGAAYVIGGGCSDDGFMDFRGWLISMGRDVFEKALSDAESLADVASAPGIEGVFFEEFLNVPAQVFEEATGREVPEYTGHSRVHPAGEKWNEAREDLERRFPRLWAKYRASAP
ncbi:MAG: DUF4240 domain-containing protein [Myxococcaceae bacterium]|nr:DUF4240 domain-containing protein [Myxococcaceae bacterium]